MIQFSNDENQQYDNKNYDKHNDDLCGGTENVKI